MGERAAFMRELRSWHRSRVAARREREGLKLCVRLNGRQPISIGLATIQAISDNPICRLYQIRGARHRTRARQASQNYPRDV